MVLKTDYMQRLVQKMAWTSARTTILAGNLARADMPGQKANDITPFKTLVERDKQVSKANAGKDTFGGGNIFKNFNEKTLVKNNTNLTGNSIVGDEQMQKMNDTSTMFMQSANTYQRLSDLYRRVLSGGNG